MGSTINQNIILGNYILLFFFQREEVRNRNFNESERDAWLPSAHPLLGDGTNNRAMCLDMLTCALTEKQTSDLLVHGPTRNQLSHTASQARKAPVVTHIRWQQ